MTKTSGIKIETSVRVDDKIRSCSLYSGINCVELNFYGEDIDLRLKLDFDTLEKLHSEIERKLKGFKEEQLEQARKLLAELETETEEN